MINAFEPTPGLSPAREVPGLGSGIEGLRMISALRRDPLDFLSAISRKHGGLVHVNLPGFSFYLVTKPDYIQHVLQTNQRNYIKGESVEVARLLVGYGLATSDGDLWRRQRRLMNPAFHRQRLAQLANLMTDTAERRLDGWRAFAQAGQAFDLSQEMMQLTLQIIVRTMFSLDLGDQASTIMNAFEVGLQYINDRSFTPFDLPRWLPTPGNLRFRRALKILDEQVYNLVQERRQQGVVFGDLLDMLLEARDSETGYGMDDRQLRDEVVTIFFAGHETTALTLTWVWTLLAKHQAVETRLRREIAEVLGDRTPGVEDLDDLKYTRSVLEETLRLYPPAWVFVRSAVEDDVIDGYAIPADAMIFLSPYVTQRMEQHWEKPSDFNPERFTTEHSADRHRLAYFPFGSGPRLCIGRDFALMEATLILAMMVQRYHLELVPERPVEPVPLVTLRPKAGVWVRVSHNP